jgi:hypothetical protein
MSWRKLGLVYAPTGDPSWAVSHASVPTALLVDEERIRVYVAIRDHENVGRVGWVDVDAADPRRVLATAGRPALDVGEPGTFDDSGATPMGVLRHDGRIYLYYGGWERAVGVRYHLFGGLAVSDDGGETFERHSRVPVLERSDDELQVRVPCTVIPTDEETWRMWYLGGSAWVEREGKPVPKYGIRHQESHTPWDWAPEGRVVVDPVAPDEFGFGRPHVIADRGGFKMWYSIRTFSQGYRLGYAESPDGLRWTRMDDQVGIDVSPDGWDSTMVCFACLQPTRHGTYLFYNGNDYGATGFGVAVRENDRP